MTRPPPRSTLFPYTTLFRSLGGAGADSMVGGAGDDLYFVDNPGDAISELQNDGTDEVRTTVSYTLPDWVNNLTLVGSATSGFGNPIDNVITGNDASNFLEGNEGNDTLIGLEGNDTLDGGIGADSMVGGNGDDVYFVDNAGDVIVETQNGGVDEARSIGADYTLAECVNNLTLRCGAVKGTGNAIDHGV